MQRKETLRFDDVACASTATALAKAFIERNPNVQKDGWQQPDLGEQLRCIHSEFMSYPVDGLGNMKHLVKRHHAGLVVGVIDSLDGAADVMRPCASSAYVGVEVPFRRVRVRHSAVPDATEVFLPERRIEIAERKFSTPNRGVVSGPYLFVAAIDLPSGLALRFRAWPIWLGGYLQVVRSHYERVCVGALDALGCPCMTPMRIDQLRMLQEALGFNWQGSIRTYPYLMDVLLWPSFGHRVGIVEILGLGRYKRYADGQEPKRVEIIEGVRRGDFTAKVIDVPRGALSVVEAYITEHLTNFVTSAGPFVRMHGQQPTNSPIVADLGTPTTSTIVADSP